MSVRTIEALAEAIDRLGRVIQAVPMRDMDRSSILDALLMVTLNLSAWIEEQRTVIILDDRGAQATLPLVETAQPERVAVVDRLKGIARTGYASSQDAAWLQRAWELLEREG